MAKKLIDIENEIKSKSIDFSDYLNNLFPDKIVSFINEIKLHTNVYLFSGIIRDFFIHQKNDFRDIDLIIEDELEIETIYSEMVFKKNSFGGYKIIIENINIDLWVVKNTWALNYGQLKLSFEHIDHLPYTTFFNFSSILFSLNTNKFIVGKPFLQFLRDKKINVVFKDNPYPELCIINSFYYSDKYKIKLSKELIKYIINEYNLNISSYIDIQKKHYGYIKYSIDDLIKRINSLKQ